MENSLEASATNKISKNYILSYLYRNTGFKYCFAHSSSRIWNKVGEIEQQEDGNDFCQIMPEQSDNSFFDWYVLERQYNQFFKTEEKAFVFFLKYLEEWKDMQKR